MQVAGLWILLAGGIAAACILAFFHQLAARGARRVARTEWYRSTTMRVGGQLRGMRTGLERATTRLNSRRGSRVSSSRQAVDAKSRGGGSTAGANGRASKLDSCSTARLAAAAHSAKQELEHEHEQEQEQLEEGRQQEGPHKAAQRHHQQEQELAAAGSGSYDSGACSHCGSRLSSVNM